MTLAACKLASSAILSKHSAALAIVAYLKRRGWRADREKEKPECRLRPRPRSSWNCLASSLPPSTGSEVDDARQLTVCCSPNATRAADHGSVG
jgi:hypothetical protein